VPPERKEWLDRYNRLADAFLKKDSKALRELVAPDSQWLLLKDRKVNFAGAMAEFNRKYKIIAPNVQYTLNVTKQTVNGTQATVERTAVLAGFVYDAQKGRHNTFDGSGWEDVWAKTPHGWMLKSARQVNERLSLDGRPMDPYAPGAADARAAQSRNRRK
jgi:hypothetical protein